MASAVGEEEEYSVARGCGGAVYGCLRTPHVLYGLEELETSIGRGEDCDLVLDGHGISRLHARLVFTTSGAAPQLTDMGSSNGTFVNGLRLQPHIPRDLQEGDAIQFSVHEKTIYVFEMFSRPNASAPPEPPGPLAPPAQPDRAAGFCPRPPPRQSFAAAPQPPRPSSPRPPSEWAGGRCGGRGDPGGRCAGVARDPPGVTTVQPAAGRRPGSPAPWTGGRSAETGRRRHDSPARSGGAGRAPRAAPVPVFPNLEVETSALPEPPASFQDAPAPAQAQPPSFLPQAGPQFIPVPMPYPVMQPPPHLPQQPPSYASPHSAVGVAPNSMRNHLPGHQYEGYPPCAPSTPHLPQTTAVEENQENKQLAERLRQLEDRVAQIPKFADQAGIASEPHSPANEQPAQGPLQQQAADAASMACSALALMRAADHVSGVPGSLWKLRERVQPTDLERPAWAEDLIKPLDLAADGSQGIVALAEQVLAASRRLERVVGCCETEATDLERSLDARREESSTGQQAAIQCHPGSGHVPKADEEAALRAKCAALTRELQELRAQKRCPPPSSATNARAQACQSESDAAYADVLAMDEVVAELRKHLDLYGKALGATNDCAEDAESEPVEVARSVVSMPVSDLAATVSSLRSFINRGASLGRDDMSAVLSALIAARRRLAQHERNAGGGIGSSGDRCNRRRWRALAEEIQRLRGEADLQGSRAEELRSAHSVASAAAESDAAELRRCVLQAKAAAGDGSGMAAAALLEQLQRVEQIKKQQEARLHAAQETAKDAKKRYEELKARAAFAATLHAEGEEIADRLEEHSNSGAALRAERLRRANATLQTQVAGTEALQAELQGRVLALRGVVGQHALVAN